MDGIWSHVPVMKQTHGESITRAQYRVPPLPSGLGATYKHILYTIVSDPLVLQQSWLVGIRRPRTLSMDMLEAGPKLGAASLQVPRLEARVST